jgi:hypothetical protein
MQSKAKYTLHAALQPYIHAEDPSIELLLFAELKAAAPP